MPIYPPNHVEIRTKSRDGGVEIRTKSRDGGVEILLDGYDLAPHVDDWQIHGDAPGEPPHLIVKIPCASVVMDVAEAERPADAIVRAQAEALRRTREALGEQS